MSVRGDNIRNRIPDEYEKTAGYLIFDVSEAVGLEMDSIDATLNESVKNFDADNLSGADLEKYVYQRKGIIRKPADFARGFLTVTGTGTVAVDDLFETENGVQFRATANVEVIDTGVVPIVAVVAGNSGIVGANSIVEMPVTIAGISACTNEEATAGGYDAESDADLLARFYEAIQNPSGNGNKASYKAWAKEVTGIGDAKVFPLGHGIGTVDVVVIDSDKKPASTGLVAEVQNYIDPNSSGIGDGVAPIGATCYVSSATGKAINITATVAILASVEQNAIKEAIEKAVTEYLARIAFASDKVSLAQVGNAILDVEGVVDYESLKLNGVTGNVSVAEREVAILGNVVITWA